jgi:hypothetical protein
MVPPKLTVMAVLGHRKTRRHGAANLRASLRMRRQRKFKRVRQNNLRLR